LFGFEHGVVERLRKVHLSPDCDAARVARKKRRNAIPEHVQKNIDKAAPFLTAGGIVAGIVVFLIVLVAVVNSLGGSSGTQAATQRRSAGSR
jgi:hypothetical protein